MVLEYLQELLPDRFGCDEEQIVMAAALDDLNLSDDDRAEIAICLLDLYGVEISPEALQNLETVEDMVGYVEDRL